MVVHPSRARRQHLNGLALTILVGQLPRLFGFSVSADGLIDDARGFAVGARGFAVGLAARLAVPAAITVGGGSLVLILAPDRLLPRVPGVLVAVVASSALAHGVTDVMTEPVKPEPKR